MAQPPNLLQGPEPVETAELHFKLSCKLKIFESESKYEGGHCCVLAVSQHYGLIFVGNTNGFSVIKTKSLSPTVDPEKFPRREVILKLRPTHISVDFTQKILAVVCSSKPGSVLVFYDLQSFGNKDITPLKVIPVVKLIQNLAAEVIDLTWQPNADSSLMICFSDGSVLALSQGVKDGPTFTLPNTTQATCFCWSPKGKQIVIGSASGTLSQYKPDLKVVKTLPPPPLFNGAAMVVSVLWISSYQFAVAYNDRANPESFPVITVVNAAKNEPVNVINYDDITYSSTLFRNHQIYMTHQSAWNLIFVSSANSIEVAVLHSKDGSAWEQWLLGDASRAELPLNPDRQETFPLGWAFDLTSQEGIPWGEGSLPPMPRLLLMSDEGILCVFNVVHAGANMPQLCAPPKDNLDDSLFVSSSKDAPLPPAEPPKPVQTTKSILGTPFTFGNAKPTYTFETSPGFGGFGAAKPQVSLPQATPIIFSQQLQQQPLQHQPQQQPLQQQSQQQLQLQQSQQQLQLQQSQQQLQLQQSQQQLQLQQSQQQLQQQQSQQQLQLQQQPQMQSFSILPDCKTATFKLTPREFGMSSNLFTPSSTTPLDSKLDAPKIATTAKVTPPQVGLKPTIVQADLFGGKTLPQSTPIKQPEIEKAAVTPPAPAVKKPEEVEHVGKSEETPSLGESPGPGTPELAAVDDSVYLSAIEEEIEHFNSELQQLPAKVGNFSCTLGTEEDKARMKRSIDGLYDFWKELKETTKGQSAEIHAVVMDLMEAFAWLEDAKSRNLQKKNPSYIELKKSEELDPLSARHMSEIGHLKYYIENQLKQLTGYLEKEWMDHQENYRNEVKGRMAVPPLEEVYKTMHFQLKILHKQKLLVEELKEKIAMKKRMKSDAVSIASPIPTQTNENRVSELSKLAENLLQLKITKEENSPHSGTWEMIKAQLNAISERSRKLTRAKQTALRDALSEYDMVKIRPVKTTLESSTFLRSLALEKAAQKSAKLKSQKKVCDLKENLNVLPKKSQVFEFPSKPVEVTPFKEAEKLKSAEKSRSEVPKIVNSPLEKAQIPLTVQSVAEAEEKSPLASLSGIVSSIGAKTEAKPPSSFTFGNTSLQKTESNKDNSSIGTKTEAKSMSSFTFGNASFQKSEWNKDAGTFAKLDGKQEKPKTAQAFTFVMPKPNESIFEKKEPTTFGAKPIFGGISSTPIATTKLELPKTTAVPNVTVTAATTTTSSVFTFGPATTTASTVAPPKMNLVFSGKEQISGFGTSNSSNLFAVPSTVAQGSASSFFSSGASLFGGANKTTTTAFGTPAVSVFEVAKTTSVGSVQSTGFTFTQPATTNVTAATPVKPTSETEDVDVVKVDEPVKKPETSAKEAPKVTVATSIFGTPPAPTKTVPETTTPSVPPNVTVVSTPQSTVSASGKPAIVVATTAATTTTAESTVIVKGTTTTATAASTFSFSKGVSQISFGQTATTTTATTTTSLFESPTTTTTSIFGQVSSTTPTTNIFGGGTTTTPTTNIFGGSTTTNIFGGSTPTTSTSIAFGSTPTKPIFPQSTTPSTTSESIFGASTPTTNTFGQVGAAAASSPTGFGTKPDTVSQTTNLFGQLLSDSNRSVFGSSPTTPNTGGKLFGGSNIFGGGGTTTTSSSIFPQTTSIFGQSTTSSNIFGQSQTSPSNSFFGQNVCSPFGGGTAVTSNQTTFESGGFSKPKFGERPFGQTTNSASIFGGSQNTSLFGGASSTTSGNVFQTPTTSTTFGSTSTPGPFSGGVSSFGESSFGSTATSFQKPLGGFGSPPVFGGGPAFGGSPTFGGSPSFGSGPTFGSLSQGTFGQSASSTTFENLANQNTVGFGNLAQQSQNQGFGFGSSSFENKPAFGGNSFSSWRSK